MYSAPIVRIVYIISRGHVTVKNFHATFCYPLYKTAHKLYNRDSKGGWRNAFSTGYFYGVRRRDPDHLFQNGSGDAGPGNRPDRTRNVRIHGAVISTLHGIVSASRFLSVSTIPSQPTHRLIPILAVSSQEAITPKAETAVFAILSIRSSTCAGCSSVLSVR